MPVKRCVARRRVARMRVARRCAKRWCVERRCVVYITSLPLVRNFTFLEHRYTKEMDCYLYHHQGASGSWNIPVPSISVILLPIIGNAVEHMSAIMFSMKDKLDITLGVSAGSSTQISTFVIPFCVVVGWFMGRPMNLNLHLFETTTLLVTLLVVAFFLQEGTPNYFKGLMLIRCCKFHCSCGPNKWSDTGQLKYDKKAIWRGWHHKGPDCLVVCQYSYQMDWPSCLHLFIGMIIWKRMQIIEVVAGNHEVKSPSSNFLVMLSELQRP